MSRIDREIDRRNEKEDFGRLQSKFEGVCGGCKKDNVI